MKMSDQQEFKGAVSKFNKKKTILKPNYYDYNTPDENEKEFSSVLTGLKKFNDKLKNELEKKE
jgi:hypothetical protein